MNLTAQQQHDHKTRMECGRTSMVQKDGKWLKYTVGGKSCEWVGSPWDATGYTADDAATVASLFRGQVVTFRGV